MAAPRSDASAQYKLAIQLHDSGDYDKALASIADGLAIAPRDLLLLGLKGAVLLELRDYAGARAAYQAYLDAGAKGANRREAQKIVANLRAVESTFLDIAAANGPATIYLDSRTRGVFCTAAPSCNKPVLPGDYKVIAERAGFERWTGQVSVENATTAKLATTLVESASPLTVRVAPPDARVAVDGAAAEASATLAPGKHQVVVSLAGYAEARLETTAHEGKPIEFDVGLTQLVPIRVEPPAAMLVLDDTPAAVKNGRIAIPPGSHVLVARAQGARERRIEIPAERAADYRLDVEFARIEVAVKTREPVPTCIVIGASMAEAGVVGLGIGFVLDLREQADGSATTPGTVVIAASGAAIVAGVILSLTAPSERRPQAALIVPTLGDDRVGLAVAGRF